jgi:hypothetical protein
MDRKGPVDTVYGFSGYKENAGSCFWSTIQDTSVTVALKQAGITAGSESSSNSVAVWSKRPATPCNALCPQVQPDTGMIRSVHSE